MVTLRGLRARAGQSALLFATGLLVVAGCVAAVTYQGRADGTAEAAAGVVVLGVVALASEATTSIRVRRHEMTLAALRGRHGLRLLRAAAAEPVLILLAAGVAGTTVGALIPRRSAVGSGETSNVLGVPTAGLLTAVIVIVVCVITVTMVSWRGVNEPLPARLADPRRSATTSPIVWFLQLLVLVGAAVALYRARSLGVRHANWVSFVSPALLGLAAGQLGIWLLTVLSRLGLRGQSLIGGLGWYLTLRRFSRSTSSLSAVRLVVSAVVVAGIAATAWLRAGSWLTDTAHINAGGPITFAVPAGGLQAYAASHQVDPHGRWLMAMSAAPNASGGSYRDVFVDSARWKRVVGAFYAETPVAEVAAHIQALAKGRPVSWTSGQQASLTLAASSLTSLPSPQWLRHKRSTRAGYGFLPLRFSIQYVNSAGVSLVAQLPKSHLRTGHSGLVTVSTQLPGCFSACAVQQVQVQGLTSDGSLDVKKLKFGDLRLIPNVPSGQEIVSSKRMRASTTTTGVRLHLANPYTARTFLAWKPPAPSPALATDGINLRHRRGRPVVNGLDGQRQLIRTAGQVSALPLLGREGVLLDLGTALRGAGAQITQSTTVVVARPDTPPGVLKRLQGSDAVGRRLTLDSALSKLQARGAADVSGLYLLLAEVGLLIAALSVISAIAEQRGQRRREAASLRVAGVHSAAIDAGYRGEVVTLAALVAVVAAAATELGCRALLGVLPLVQPRQFDVSLDATPIPALTAGLALCAGLFVALVTYLALRLVSRTSPPSTLRTDAS